MATPGQVAVRFLVYMVSLAISLMILPRILWQRWKLGKHVFHVKACPTPPPILTDPQWGTHAYMNLKTQGIKLHYVEAGDRNNPLLIFVHGFPECWFSWRHQLKYFSQNYWVVAVDLRGYGDSDKPAATSQYNVEHLVNDLKEFVLGLGKKQCTLVAHDWGALLAWRLVSAHPDLFSAHISCNGPHPDAFMKCLKASPKQIAKSWYIFFFQMPWLPELILRMQDLQALVMAFRGKRNNIAAFPDDVIEAYKYYYSQKGALTPPINYYRNISFAPGKQLPKIRVPTLIIWGTEDEALSKPIATLAVEMCESAEVKFVEGASHWVQQEEPHIVNKLIHQYLDSSFSSHKVH